MSRNEVSLSMIFGILSRVEDKLDDFSSSSQRSPAPDEGVPVHKRYQIAEDSYSFNGAEPSGSPVDLLFGNCNAPVITPSSVSRTRVSFSAYKTLNAIAASGRSSASSPLLRAMQPKLVSTAALELNRPSIHLIPSPIEPDILEGLTFTTIKELSNTYFTTFNRIYPIVDRDFYYAYTLNLVIQDGFDYNIESCVVLIVMALGCLGMKAYMDGGFIDTSSSNLDIRRFLEGTIPGASLMTESIKRIGFCICEASLQSCQYYLLCATFYEQATRPMCEWMMINRACTACAALAKFESHDVDEWQADMQSRIFWTCLLRETIISQEFEMIPSGLQDLEDQTPLPRFVRYPLRRPRVNEEDDSYYHYHFLAQLALRIILTRIRNELYFTEPSSAVAEELVLQLHQWRDNLPAELQFFDQNPPAPRCPAEAVAISLLVTRYTVARYHIGRPFMLKAIRAPSEITENDLDICSKTMKSAMEWPMAQGVCRKLKTMMPVKYFACVQYVYVAKLCSLC